MTTTSTLAERISRKAASLVAGKPDPEPAELTSLAKAEAALSAAREDLHQKDQAARQAEQDAALTGDMRALTAARRALQAAQEHHRDVAKVYELVVAHEATSKASAEQAALEAAVEKLAKPRYEVAAAIDVLVKKLGEAYAKRQSLDDELIKLVPDGRYSGRLGEIGDSDRFFKELLGIYRIPGGTVSLRGPEMHRTCAEVARSTSAAARAAVKAKAPK